MLVEVEGALRAAIAAAWPEVVAGPLPAGGIYWPFEINKLLFGTQKTPPFAIIDPSLRRDTSGRFPITTFTQTGTIRIFRLDADDYDTNAFVGHLDTIAQYLEQNDLAVGRRLSPVDRHMNPADSSLGRYFIDTRKPFLFAWVEFEYTISTRYTP